MTNDDGVESRPLPPAPWSNLSEDEGAFRAMLEGLVAAGHADLADAMYADFMRREDTPREPPRLPRELASDLRKRPRPLGNSQGDRELRRLVAYLRTSDPTGAARAEKLARGSRPNLPWKGIVFARHPVRSGKRPAMFVAGDRTRGVWFVLAYGPQDTHPGELGFHRSEGLCADDLRAVWHRHCGGSLPADLRLKPSASQLEILRWSAAAEPGRRPLGIRAGATPTRRRVGRSRSAMLRTMEQQYMVKPSGAPTPVGRILLELLEE